MGKIDVPAKNAAVKEGETMEMAAFSRRHIGLSDSDCAKLLKELGLKDFDQLMKKVVPDTIVQKGALDLGQPLSEADCLAHLAALANQNEVKRSLIGLGYYDCYTPPVIQRNILENPGWYTSYTPYQPEISQGRLEALLNYQTMIIDLTGLAVTNASLLDEATAGAEAMGLMKRMDKAGRELFFVHEQIFPQTIDVLKTRAKPLGITLVIGDFDLLNKTAQEGQYFGCLLPQLGKEGEIFDLTSIIATLKEQKILTAVATDLLALTLLKSPGEMGADMALGSAQRFGVPLFHGGPHAAFLSVGEPLKRALPGRIVGVSVDTKGRKAYRLALQTREQHIRREKATSNICTAQALLAIMAGFYGVYHGSKGLKVIARRVHYLARLTHHHLQKNGIDIGDGPFFDTLSVKVKGKASAILKKAQALGLNLWQIDKDALSFAFDETCDEQTVITLLEAFGIRVSLTALQQTKLGKDGLQAHERKDEILTHPVFHDYRSETEIMRYMRRLMDKDIALDRAMIPLGSCTMKLNPAASLIPVSFEGFARMHPFVPLDQAKGSIKLIKELERLLVEITGYDAVSLQPNAGSQGEYAGLLAIKAYHEANGDDARNICLIPSSAHGTNPASAQMAGFKVVVVKCDDEGNIDLADLKGKITEHKASLGAIMITYPSTHGVFEETIKEVCALIHKAGGQVYLDGANLNALVGQAQPGQFGADVSHLNLHKTFAIPHGGGGPGVGPVAVKAHLARFLPGHFMFTGQKNTDQIAHSGVVPEIGPVSAAPFGSSGILPISYAYIKMMGSAALKQATEVAILSANYLAKKLSPHYDILYKGAHGFVAHEAILDLRPLTEKSGVTVEDVAKRLMDFGFHAPTMSWPVAGTLMIEPTESESLKELDRFIEAMILIKKEIDQIISGTWALEDSPLRHSPHTAEDLLSDDWARPYQRALGAYPAPGLKAHKYWPPISRIDNVAGDRNLICSCPALDTYVD